MAAILPVVVSDVLVPAEVEVSAMVSVGANDIREDKGKAGVLEISLSRESAHLKKKKGRFCDI